MKAQLLLAEFCMDGKFMEVQGFLGLGLRGLGFKGSGLWG